MAPPFDINDSKHGTACQHSVYEALSRHVRRGFYPFHMPGHKGNTAFLPPEHLLSLDVTELDGTDNLHSPNGCIAETERRIADIYGADKSFLLINGSTAGLTAAICAVCGDGDVIAVDRHCHRAVYSGMILSGAHPIYFFPLSKNLPDIPNIKAVVVTSPTYDGAVLDISAIAAETHKRGAVLIVDEAHGAHFPFHSQFPQGALSLGADVAVHSFHKTLPAFSQSAGLHVKGSRVNTAMLRQMLTCMQTSSPSYMIMAATDFMFNKLQSEPHLYDIYTERLLKLRIVLNLPSRNSFDISKILIDKPKGREWADSHKLTFEMVTDKYILALTSVADTADGFNRLIKAVTGLNGVTDGSIYHPTVLPEVALSPKTALKAKTRKVKLTDSAGEVCGCFISPFPPGVPILAPGERITSEIIENLLASGAVNRDCEIEILLI